MTALIEVPSEPTRIKPGQGTNAKTVAGFTCGQNYPNPFNPATTIDYTLPARSHVKLSVYNVLGQEVAALVNETQNPGRYNATFDAAKLESGVYLYKIQAGDFSRTEKMLLVK